MLRSKAAVTRQELGDKYVMLGPLTPNHVQEVELCFPEPGSPLDSSLKVRGDYLVLAQKYLPHFS